MSQAAKVAQIKAASDARKKEIEREHALEMGKLYGGAALEIGSAMLPGMGTTKAATTITKALAPKIGRKIASEIGAGVVRGGASGGIEGLGRGMIEGKNPVKTAAQDAVTGAALGGAGGVVGGNIQKGIKGSNLKSYGNIDSLEPTKRKQYTKDARGYYQDYIQGTKLNRFGDIEFSKRGVQEQLRWNPELAKNFPELKKDLNTAKRLPNEPNKDALDKKYTKYFEVYRGKNGDHLIERFEDGRRRYYMTKNIPTGTPHATSTGSNRNASNIIPHQNKSFNPAEDIFEWLKRKRGLK